MFKYNAILTLAVHIKGTVLCYKHIDTFTKYKLLNNKFNILKQTISIVALSYVCLCVYIYIPLFRNSATPMNEARTVFQNFMKTMKSLAK